MICRHVLTRNHPWLSMYIHGMLLNKKKKSLVPKTTVIVAKQIELVTISVYILVSSRKNVIDANR